jgi:hypothetical protein
VRRFSRLKEKGDKVKGGRKKVKGGVVSDI